MLFEIYLSVDQLKNFKKKKLKVGIRLIIFWDIHLFHFPEDKQ